MDPQELDAWLRQHTESEERYLAHDDAYLRERLERIGSTEGGSLRVPLGSILFQEGRRFFFKKHSRFNDYPEHVHDWVELEYMYSGSCVQYLNGMPLEVKEGQALLVDQNTRHKVPELGEDQILLNLIFGPETIPSLLGQLDAGASVVTGFLTNTLSRSARKDSYILFASEGSWRLRTLVQLFCCDILEEDTYLDERLTAVFHLIMMELIHLCQKGKSSASLEDSRQISVLPALQAIEGRYPDITLEEIASEMGVSPAYLSRLLKKQTGSSFQRLLTRQRMSEAARLLSLGTSSVTEVANHVGYSNVTFFYRKFQDEFGCSPGEWREQRHAV
jgi:AraC-like DNA-binding protein